MANQALINAAQKMYSAKSAEAQRNLAPILNAAASATDRIVTAVAAKRKEQEKESKEKIEPFKNLLLKNPKLRPELTKELTKLQEKYFENLKIAEGLFRSKKSKEDAVQENEDIATLLRKVENQMVSVDLNKKLTTKISKSNLLGPLVDDAIIKDESVVDSIELRFTGDYENDGIYFKGYKQKPIPLDQYKPLNEIATQSITKLNNAIVFAEDFGYKGRGFEGAVKNSALTAINAELEDDNNFMSLMFDDIGGFNYAKENLRTKAFPGYNEANFENKTENEQLEILKQLVISNPEAFRNDFRNDFMQSVEMANKTGLDAYAKEQRKVDARADRSKRDFYPTAFGSSTKAFVQGKFDDIKNGYVTTPKGTYKEFDDGFYLLDTGGGKLNPDAAPTSETQLVADMGMSGYTTDFNFAAEASESPEISENEKKIKELKTQVTILQAEADEAEKDAKGKFLRTSREKAGVLFKQKTRDIERLKNQIKELESQE